jgi:hypothetical protein
VKFCYTEMLCVIERCGVQLRYTALLQCRDGSRADVLVRCTGAVSCNMWTDCVEGGRRHMMTT